MTIIPENLMIHKPKKELLELMDKNELKEKVLFETESDFHNIKVVENSIGRFLKYQDTYQAGLINSKTYKGNLPYINYFLIPYLMNKNIKDILLVGFGSGILVNQFEKIFSKLNKIDIVDIEENIFEIAQKYFNFKNSDKYDFHLQDAMIYLKTTRKKYDLIIVDVAGDFGIDERFVSPEYIELIKKCLKTNGIFVSNLPSSIDIYNKKNKFFSYLLDLYKANFNYLDIYNGNTSNKIFYKEFFNIDEIVLDVTNLIFITSNKKYQPKNNNSLADILNIDIQTYLNDKIILQQK